MEPRNSKPKQALEENLLCAAPQKTKNVDVNVKNSEIKHNVFQNHTVKIQDGKNPYKSGDAKKRVNVRPPCREPSAPCRYYLSSVC